MTVVLVVAAFVAYLALRLVFFYREVHRRNLVAASIPGPKTYPFIGNLLLFRVSQGQLLYTGLKIASKYGDIFRLWLGPYLAVAITDPDDLQVVFNSPHLATKAAAYYDGLLPVIGNGLISLNGADYKRHRKAITTSMHLDILQGFVVVFNANCRKLVRRMDKLAEDDEIFDSAPLVGWCASHSVCQTVLSTAAGLDAEKTAFVESLDVASKVLLFRCLRPWYGIRALFKLSSQYDRYQSVVKGMSDFAGIVLEKKMEEVARRASLAPGDIAKPCRQTFLDQFLASAEASVLSRTELFDELRTLVFTGAGTSMDFQALFLLCIALEPEVQRKVQKELDDVFGDQPDRDVVVTDLPHLTYLEAALKETLRYFPPAPVYGRQATQDVQLPSGHSLPNGTMVIISPLLVHRNERLYPDPLKFDPERFLGDSSRSRHPYSFIPFSAGSRNCIGQRYAIMFAKTVMASVLRRFDVLPDPKGPRNLKEVPLVGGISLSVKGGARIMLRHRACVRGRNYPYTQNGTNVPGQ